LPAWVLYQISLTFLTSSLNFLLGPDGSILRPFRLFAAKHNYPLPTILTGWPSLQQIDSFILLPARIGVIPDSLCWNAKLWARNSGTRN